MKPLVVMFALLLALSGCQTSPHVLTAPTENTAFMGLWKVYRHCEAGTELDAIRPDAMRLHRAAQGPLAAMEPEVPLPDVIRRLVAEPAVRLAVDPKAMAAACSLRTGEAALLAGRHDVADEMFRLVLAYPEGRYPYYVSEARNGLSKMDFQARPVIDPISPGVASLDIRTVSQR